MLLKLYNAHKLNDDASKFVCAHIICLPSLDAWEPAERDRETAQQGLR